MRAAASKEAGAGVGVGEAAAVGVPATGPIRAARSQPLESTQQLTATSTSAMTPCRPAMWARIAQRLHTSSMTRNARNLRVHPVMWGKAKADVAGVVAGAGVGGVVAAAHR